MGQIIQDKTWKIEIINTYQYEGAVNPLWAVDFHYWKTGTCACTRKKYQLLFEKEPTDQDILEEFNSLQN